MTTSIEIPLFIIKKSKKYYQNTLNGKFIHKDRLQQYIHDNRARQDKSIFK